MKKIDTLCLVDDDSIFQFLTSEVIKSTDLVDRIELFSNGYEAIEFLKSVQDRSEELPEVIFLDLFMPVMDGWNFLEEYILLKPKLTKKITIYIVSSSIDPVDIKRAKAITEITDYIIKPITKDKFISTIRNLA